MLYVHTLALPRAVRYVWAHRTRGIAKWGTYAPTFSTAGSLNMSSSSKTESVLTWWSSLGLLSHWGWLWNHIAATLEAITFLNSSAESFGAQFIAVPHLSPIMGFGILLPHIFKETLIWSEVVSSGIKMTFTFVELVIKRGYFDINL